MPEPHPLLDWFASVGITLHPHLYLAQDPLTGLSFYTAQPLPPDTTVIRVPRQLCITSQSALERVQALLRELCGSVVELDPAELPAPDWILLYLVLCRMAEVWVATDPQEQEGVRKVLEHLAYVAHIPKVITTPLHFSVAELGLLANTPLVASTEKRLSETIIDYERARALLLPHLTPLSSGQGFAAYLAHTLQPVTSAQVQTDPMMARTQHAALELWRWAESAFTSRSFPPRLIGLSSSAPVLIPGYDTFNHARARAVTWSLTNTDVCMTLNHALPTAPVQVYNNYGGKSNEEFLAGYGFTLDTCSEDTLALRLGGSGDAEVASVTHYWRTPTSAGEEELRDAEGRFVEPACPAPGLPEEIRRTCVHSPGLSSVEVYGRVLEVLEAMLLGKRKAFRSSQRAFDDLIESTLVEGAEAAWDRAKPDMVRRVVYDNVARYRKGQLALLNHAVQWTRAVLERVDEVMDAEQDEMDEDYEEDEAREEVENRQEGDSR